MISHQCVRIFSFCFTLFSMAVFFSLLLYMYVGETLRMPARREGGALPVVSPSRRSQITSSLCNSASSKPTGKRRKRSSYSQVRCTVSSPSQPHFLTSLVRSIDEKDSSLWGDVEVHGWYRIDHDKEETEKKYGGWHPALLDVVIQSMVSGFVGTTGSTFSLLSLKRVKSWNNGFGVLDRAPGF